MDPPAAPIAATLSSSVALANQNLLHPATSPFASEAERLVLDWIRPSFGMAWGLLCSGSSIANLTALWAAREAGAKSVVASVDAHVSVSKAAHLLGMRHLPIATDHTGRLSRKELPDLSDAALVLTAGTTGRGVIDELSPVSARWLHVDAAWAGPLRLTNYAHLLEGIEAADSVAISAHKWLFQPKGAGFVLFREFGARDTISFSTSYLAQPNVGIEGSRSATAVLLLATFLAWGRVGLASRIEHCMRTAETLARRLQDDDRVELRQFPETGVINWRPYRRDVAQVLEALEGTSSSVSIAGELWARQVAANPCANEAAIWQRIDEALG